MTNPVWAQRARRVFVVVPPTGQSADSAEVGGVVEALKSQRARFKVDSSVLPILRLRSEQSTHQQLMGELGIRLHDDTQIYLCRRGGDGWPRAVMAFFEGPDAAERAVRTALGLPVSPPRHKSEPVRTESVSKMGAPGSPEVGLLLVYRGESGDSQESVKAFLGELGQYWAQRYGRVKPTPYPLGYYNLSNPEVSRGVARAFPNLAETEAPVVALAMYRQGVPVRLLEVFPDLSLPAGLVRRISSVRTRHLAHTLEIESVENPELPAVEQLELSREMELKVVQSRLHELARQLWSSSSDGKNGENRVTRRVLQRIAELTAPAVESNLESQALLSAALEDFEAEPLILPEGSDMEPLQEQLLHLGRSLLGD